MRTKGTFRSTLIHSVTDGPWHVMMIHQKLSSATNLARIFRVILNKF